MKLGLLTFLLCLVVQAQATEANVSTATQTQPIVSINTAQPDGGRWCLTTDHEDPPPDCVPGE